MPRHRLDHLVYATPDLDAAVNALEAQLGVRAIAGGQHPGLGTRNALLGLGPRMYLEIVGPDPEQPAHATPRWFRIDSLRKPTLVTWCAAGHDLAQLRADAEVAGIPLGEVRDGGRVRPDGVRLAWQVTSPLIEVEHGLVPFFIDWLDSPHPADRAPAGVQLVELVAQHPAPELLTAKYEALGLDVEVRSAAEYELVAVLESSRGRVELR
jgi:hypothetical protein